MGDMAEVFNAMREYNKEKREERNNIYEPQLIKLGAVKKSEAVYEIDNWLCYPTKGFCMNKNNNKKRMNLDKFIRSKKCTKY
jgi:hypothetical protein